MTSVWVAIDPTFEKTRGFERFCSVLRFFQMKGVFSRASIGSIIHASLYPGPAQWYRERKGELAKEARAHITQSCDGKFSFDSTQVLTSDTHSAESLVSQLVSSGRRRGHDLLVVASSDRTGLPHWILGSFSETAALTATMPVLVVKPQTDDSAFSRDARFVMAVDPSVPLSANEIRWIARLAGPVRAEVDLVYVQPRRRVFIDSLQQRKSMAEAKSILKAISQRLQKQGIKSKVIVSTEDKSIAHTIIEYAKKRRAWITIVANAERTRARKLLLGSTARRILSLTERPFLSLRLE